MYPLETEYGTTNTTDPSKGYSDAKIKTYNMSKNTAYYNNSSTSLTDDNRSSYSAEYKYPSMTVVYNAPGGTAANRNTAVSLKTSNSTGYWLSSRCVYATRLRRLLLLTLCIRLRVVGRSLCVRLVLWRLLRLLRVASGSCS